MKTILIAGCLSGFGLDIAKYFLAQGWTVIATMRTPQPDILPASDRLRILPLDVTSADSIGAAVAAAGPIDVLVNNAGIGWLNALEGAPLDVVRDVPAIAAAVGLYGQQGCSERLHRVFGPRTAVLQYRTAHRAAGRRAGHQLRQDGNVAYPGQWWLPPGVCRVCSGRDRPHAVPDRAVYAVVRRC
ncbi:MAG: SDR family NAD(P)-dependent oxidoreductase [Candidatus Devosia euplotis]|nr:SDR family NAD(P)-dependent oxidoreductase [Candidatus Devosia euplotis]